MNQEYDFSPDDFTETARSVMEACAQADDSAARARLLAESGLTGILVPESAGGLGLPLEFAVPALAAAGAHLLAYPLLETMLVARAFAESQRALVASLVTGEKIATIAWSGQISGTSGEVGRAPLGRDADYVLVFGTDGSSRLLPTNASRVMLTDDASLDLVRLETSFAVSGINETMRLATDQTEALKGEALVLHAAMALGTAEACLARASEYAQDRRQFGRPLSANQAIRHQLARHCLIVETIRNAIKRALSPRCENAAAARNAAFIAAVEGAVFVAEGAIQIHGGMGFTWDLPVHRHLRLVQALAAQGNVSRVIETIGDALINERVGETHYDAFAAAN